MCAQTADKGVVVVISGPSGVGKSTICRELVRRMKNVMLSVSVTTRPKAPTEIDGRDYWYIARQEFENRVRQGGFLEYAEVFGNLYGTPKDKVDEAITAGKTVILEIDVQGGKQAKTAYPDAVMIFIVAPTQNETAERLKHRAREDAETAQKRLDAAANEIAIAKRYYEHTVINDKLEDAVRKAIRIIEAARRAKDRTAGSAHKLLESR